MSMKSVDVVFMRLYRLKRRRVSNDRSDSPNGRAARWEDRAVAGVFSSNAERSKLVGEERGLHPSRVYDDYRAMATEEANLPAGKRIDFVSVVTPNQFALSGPQDLLEIGFNIICDSR